MAEKLYRKQHMEVLLHTLTAHADAIRHHIRGTAHNATLGAAAESGVRDIVRRHLPSTLTVTSGFVRSSNGKLLEPGEQNDLSRQTDIIIYDSTRACPLYRFDDIEIVAAEDVLAVIEVKDASSNEGVLSQGDESKSALGALEHMKRLAEFVPEAFRAIVLLQGGDPAKALSEIAAANLSIDSAPHAIYCRAYDDTKEGYLGITDEIAGEFQVHAYKDDRGSPLVAFLRMLVGYMVARGLMSDALLRGLAPFPATSKDAHRLRDDALPSLIDAVLAHGKTLENAALLPTHEKFRSYIKHLSQTDGTRTVISVVPASGLDGEGRPTVGSLLRVDHEATEPSGDVSRSVVASFFSVHERVRLLECVGAPKSDPWQISDELLIHHIRRTLTDTARVAIVSDREHVTSQR